MADTEFFQFIKEEQMQGNLGGTDSDKTLLHIFLFFYLVFSGENLFIAGSNIMKQFFAFGSQ